MAGNNPGNWSIKALSAGVAASLIAAGIWALATKLSSDDAPRSLVGGCAAFNLHAQNQFDPVGTLIWDSPSPTSTSFRGFSPNQLITVDGWVRTRSPYPTNSAPWDSDIWFHLANDAGWVTFAGVRSVPTGPGPNGNQEPGSDPAPVDSACAGTLRL
jgi:hypothetical protein